MLNPRGYWLVFEATSMDWTMGEKIEREGCKCLELFKTTMRINVNQGDEISAEGPGSRRAKGVTEVRVIQKWIGSILTKRRGKALVQGQGPGGEWLEPADRAQDPQATSEQPR